MPCTVTFNAKVETIYNVDGAPAYERIKVPLVNHRHCDMAEFRRDARYSAYANSDLFPRMLNKLVKTKTAGDYLRLDRPRAGVDIDLSGFLARVTVTV